MFYSHEGLILWIVALIGSCHDRRTWGDGDISGRGLGSWGFCCHRRDGPFIFQSTLLYLLMYTEQLKAPPWISMWIEEWETNLRLTFTPPLHTGFPLLLLSFCSLALRNNRLSPEVGAVFAATCWRFSASMSGLGVTVSGLKTPVSDSTVPTY